MKKLSRQRRWQLKKIRQGLCMTCGGETGLYNGYCDFHGLSARLRSRLRKHCRPWMPGRQGRPPFPVVLTAMEDRGEGKSAEVKEGVWTA